MGRLRVWLVPALCCAAAAAQNAQPSVPDTAAEIGFSYKLPPDWTSVTGKTKPPDAVSSTAHLPPKGTACIRVPETARHGDPASVIVVVALPFGCYGQAMTAGDLAVFGSGAADGLKQTFDLTGPVQGAYSLGSHAFWVERSRGNPKGHNELQYTVEIVCGVLKKGAVCWMAMAADEASLRAFEQMPVTLDGDAAIPLVPASAFDKAPRRATGIEP
jgi:hypothetical protein